MVALGLWLVLVSHMFSSDSRTPRMQTTYKMFNLFNWFHALSNKEKWVMYFWICFLGSRRLQHKEGGESRELGGEEVLGTRWCFFWSIRPSKNSSAIYNISQEVIFFYFENFWSSPRMAEPFVGPLVAQAEWPFLLSPCLFAQKG